MENKTGDDEPGLRPVLDLMPESLKPPSAQKRRLFELPSPDADEAILYQHSVLCQTACRFAIRVTRSAAGNVPMVS